MKTIFAIALTVVLVSSCGFEQVNEGYRGIKTVWGKVEGEPLPPGLHFYNPVSTGVFEMDVRERKVEDKTECFTRDTQKVTVQYAVTYYPDTAKIGSLYGQFGTDWDEKIVNQVILGSVKDVVGLYNADELVGKREKARMDAEDELKKALKERNVLITKLDITNLDFDDAYERAVEAKVVATQKAAEAKNRTVEVEEKAKQTVAAAKADAESMKIRSEALSKNKGLVDYEAIQKWNGQLPHIMLGNGSMPIINLDKLVRKGAD